MENEKEILYKEQYIIRTKINLYSFSVTYDTEELLQKDGWSKDLKTGWIRGQLFECHNLINFVHGISHEQNLRSSKRFSKPPIEFNIEKWEAPDSQYKWEHTENIIFEGIEWTSANHEDWGGGSCCLGKANFNYQKKIIALVESGQQIEIPPKEKYPRYELIRILEEI